MTSNAAWGGIVSIKKHGPRMYAGEPRLRCVLSAQFVEPRESEPSAQGVEIRTVALVCLPIALLLEVAGAVPTEI